MWIVDEEREEARLSDEMKMGDGRWLNERWGQGATRATLRNQPRTFNPLAQEEERQWDCCLTWGEFTWGRRKEKKHKRMISLESDSRGVPISIDYPFYNPLGVN